MRRVGRRKLYTQWGPVGCALALSRYSSTGSNDFGPLEGNLLLVWWCNIVIGTQGLYPGLTFENTIQPTICGSHIHFWFWTFHHISNAADEWLCDMNSLRRTIPFCICLDLYQQTCLVAANNCTLMKICSCTLPMSYKDFWINVRVLKLAPGCEGKSHTWL